ncbi:MAG: hypothetical protein ACOYM2_12320 [Rectinemataceae bacterium]
MLGNHDYGGGSGNVDSAGEVQTSYTGPSKTWHMPGKFYMFDFGPARLVAVDTN